MPGLDREENTTLLPDRFEAAGLRPGAIVGHYVLRRELGHGGMGQVFLAEDTKLDREVAIKFVAVRDDGSAARFIAEARVTARCTHPNIVVIHETGEHHGVPYTVLEYIAGESLLTALKRGPMEPLRAVAIMVQVARAIAAAHARQIVHRDLKPGNILLASDGSVKVVDFGIAKYVGSGEAAAGAAGGAHGDGEVTALDQIIGTPHYMAPEQAACEPIDGRADLWAFGVTLYKMLSGVRPFERLDRAAVIERLARRDEPMPRLDTVAPDAPPALVELVARCLEKQPALRIASAAEVVAVLEDVALELRTPVSGVIPRSGRTAQVDAPEPAATTTLRGTARPSRWRAVAIAIAAAAIAIGAVVAWRRVFPATPPHRVATPASIARVEALLAEVDRYERGGQADAAARAFTAFLADERDLEAQALAWLGRADRLRDRGDRDGALDGYAHAYAGATDPAVQRRALLELGAIHLRRRAWDRLAAVVDVYEQRPGPRDVRGDELREHLQLATRTMRPTGPGAPATAALARALAGARRLAAASSVLALELDGTPALASIEGRALVVRGPDGAERARQPIGELTELRCAGHDARGTWLVATPHHDNAVGARLIRLGDAAPPLALDELAGPTRVGCRAADLDGDGADELYLIGPRALVRLVPAADGTWHRHAQTLGAEVADLVAGDVDRDGVAELVVAVGEWRAYDVRVLRVDPRGELRLDARMRLGLVSKLAVLGRDGHGRALIAAWKEDVYPTIRHLPRDRPTGAAAGLYVLAVDRHAIEIVERIDVPLTSGTGPSVHALHAADLDGDGARDVVATTCTPARCDAIAIVAERGGFAMRTIGGLEVLAVLAADADAADELVVRVDRTAAPWLLGGGGEPVPPLGLVAIPAGQPSAAVTGDPTLAGAWRRAEELARIGHVEAAVDALGLIAAVSLEPAVRADALRRAAALLRAREMPAAAVDEALAALAPEGSRARLDALLAALAEHEQSLEVADALRVIDLAARHPALTAEEQVRVNALRGQLRTATIDLFAGDAVTAPWRVADPALVHVVPGSRALTVETLGPDVVAALPLVRTAELVTLAIDAELVRTEWAAGVRLRLGPRDRGTPGAIVVELGARGGGGLYHRRRLCGTDGVGGAEGAVGWEETTPLDDADRAEAVRIEVAVRPGLGQARCAVTTDGRPAAATFAIPPSSGAEWELSIEGGADAQLTSAVMQVASIAVGGVAPAPAAADLADDAARALANHRPAEALALIGRLAPAAAATWPMRRLAAIATDEAGDQARAVATLAAAATGAAAPADLARLLRARDGQFAPIVRAAVGDRLATVLDVAWSTVAYQELDVPRIRAALIRDLDALPPPTAATAAATLSLTGYRGEAELAAGRPDDGRRALTDALALLPRAASPDVRDRAERIAHLLAAEAAVRGDRTAALAWGLRAVEVANHPELAADLLLLDPATATLASDPAWAPVIALGRPLVTGP